MVKIVLKFVYICILEVDVYRNVNVMKVFVIQLMVVCLIQVFFYSIVSNINDYLFLYFCYLYLFFQLIWI